MSEISDLKSKESSCIERLGQQPCTDSTKAKKEKRKKHVPISHATLQYPATHSPSWNPSIQSIIPECGGLTSSLEALTIRIGEGGWEGGWVGGWRGTVSLTQEDKGAAEGTFQETGGILSAGRSGA